MKHSHLHIGSLGAALLVACSGSSSPSTTPATALEAVTFASPSSAHPHGSMTAQFNGAMMAGMTSFMDLHQGDITGPVVPITCTWSSDRSTMTCTPNAALQPGSQYTLHMGAGMVASNDMPVDMSPGLGMGGEWMTSGMAGGHNGTMMGGDWEDAAGHQGMLFTFTAG